MDINPTSVYEKNLEAYRTARRALNEGGTRSSKTYSILQLLILIAFTAKRKTLISVVSESLPHLKRGAIRDFFDILGEGQHNNLRWNISDHIYTAPHGIVEFFGADESAKLRGAGRKILFINEANNVSYDAFRELDVRTSKFTFLDWNPVSEFWAHEHLIGKSGNVYIHSTYQDALDVIPPEVIDNIESNKNDPNWWNVYGLGRIGKIEGLVYPFFSVEDELPAGDGDHGLDFGFSNEPSVLVKNVIIPHVLYRKDDGTEEYFDELHSDELFYETGMTNNAIAHKMEECGIKKNYDEIWADSAEPKSIEEIHAYNFNIKGAVKGPGSVEFGYQKVRQYKQFWTKRSTNCIKEQRNFRYIPDKDGKLTEKTTHVFSHGMDARRYGVAKEASSFDTWAEALRSMNAKSKRQSNGVSKPAES